jgi:hypothetical protein
MLPRVRRVVALVAVLSLVPTIVGCGGSFSSPEACFQTMQLAGRDKDIVGMMKCLTEESQEILTGGLVMMGSMMKMMGAMPAMDGAQGADMKKQADAIVGVLEKHGVTDDSFKSVAPEQQMTPDPQSIRKLSSVVSNKPQFIADMFNVMQQFQATQGMSKDFEEQIAGTLKDVKIDGDTATAVIVTTKGEEPLSFRKTADGWKLHIDISTMGPGMGAPPA